MGFRPVSVLIGVGVFVAALATAMPAQASTDPGAGSPSKPVSQGGWAPGSEQYSHLTANQLALIQQKLQVVQRLGTVGARPNAPSCPIAPTGMTPTCPAPPAAKGISIGSQPQPNSCYCGPESTHNILMHWGINVDVNTLASVEGTICDGSTGTSRGGVATGANRYQSNNGYVWQVLGSPGGATNGLGDLWNYTVTDIWYNIPEISNVETYGYDPILGKYRYPLSPYNGYNIRHYFAVSAYNRSGMVIGGYDQNNAYNSGSGFWFSYYYENLWAAIHNHPLVDQIMW